jgi:hypothetical protein
MFKKSSYHFGYQQKESCYCFGLSLCDLGPIVEFTTLADVSFICRTHLLIWKRLIQSVCEVVGSVRRLRHEEMGLKIASLFAGGWLIDCETLPMHGGWMLIYGLTSPELATSDYDNLLLAPCIRKWPHALAMKDI